MRLVWPFLLLVACNSSPTPNKSGQPGSAPATAPSGSAQRVAIKVTKEGFDPPEVKLHQGRPAVIEMTRVVESDCLDAVRMPWMAEALPLPLHKTVEIPVDTAKAGTFRYSCWMSMVFGRVTVVP
jgi:plastocyanin domain-containing protein